MKIGINAWTFPANLSIPQGFRVAKSGGFDCVELNLAEEGYLNMGSSEAEVKALADGAHNMSLELRSISTGMFWAYPLTSNDPSVVDKAKQVVRKMLQVAQWAGADTILVVPGSVTDEVAYDVAYDRAKAALREFAKDAEEAGVYIGVENVWNKLLLSPLEMARFIDEIGSEYIGAYFDVGNVLVSGYPEQWIKILGSRIKKAHVKDFSRAVGNITGFVNILEGEVNWIAVRDAFRAIGYDDVVTAEIGGYKTLPELGIKHAGESLKRIFKGNG
ncbi:MAG: sugar phosphate isomerase/epimerase family protein [Armatimonadota bacterium]|nr:sugar phosphate isomerase/epimerase family protein [Armatimonadota bacterium]